MSFKKESNGKIIKKMDQQMYYIKKIQYIEYEREMRLKSKGKISKTDEKSLKKSYAKLESIEFETDTLLTEFNDRYTKAMKNRFKIVNPLIKKFIECQNNQSDMIYPVYQALDEHKSLLLKRSSDIFYTESELTGLLGKKVSYTDTDTRFDLKPYRTFHSFEGLQWSKKKKGRSRSASNLLVHSTNMERKDVFYEENELYMIADKEENKSLRNFMEETDSQLNNNEEEGGKIIKNFTKKGYSKLNKEYEEDGAKQVDEQEHSQNHEQQREVEEIKPLVGENGDSNKSDGEESKSATDDDIIDENQYQQLFNTRVDTPDNSDNKSISPDKLDLKTPSPTNISLQSQENLSKHYTNNLEQQ